MEGPVKAGAVITGVAAVAFLAGIGPATAQQGTAGGALIGAMAGNAGLRAVVGAGAGAAGGYLHDRSKQNEQRAYRSGYTEGRQRQQR